MWGPDVSHVFLMADLSQRIASLKKQFDAFEELHTNFVDRHYMEHGYTSAYKKFEDDLLAQMWNIKRELDEAFEARDAPNRISVYDWKKQYYQSMRDMQEYDKQKRFKPQTFVYGKRKPAFVPKPISGPRKYNSVSGYSYGALVSKPVIRKSAYVPKPAPRKYNPRVVNAYGRGKSAFVPKPKPVPRKYNHVVVYAPKKQHALPPPTSYDRVWNPEYGEYEYVPRKAKKLTGEKCMGCMKDLTYCNC
nr:MAG: hypothetical protein [Cressdnaviricota sp.]